jgi:hypothetical protein
MDDKAKEEPDRQADPHKRAGLLPVADHVSLRPVLSHDVELLLK